MAIAGRAASSRHGVFERGWGMTNGQIVDVLGISERTRAPALVERREGKVQRFVWRGSARGIGRNPTMALDVSWRLASDQHPRGGCSGRDASWRGGYLVHPLTANSHRQPLN
jgi:hypothetical protein